MPVPSSSLTTIVDDSDPVLGELAEVPAAPAGLLECLAKVSDPRKRRGVRHSITAIVALALAATLAGAQSFVAIGEWVADAGDADLAALGIGHVLPLDGKSLRGARDAAGHLTHLLAALSQHTGTVLGQMTVGAKTNESPVLTKLLDTMDIADAVITADALHCQRGTAQYIVSRQAHYVLTVKGNQRNLRKQLRALPWKLIPVVSTDREHSHGRTATRRLKATEITAGIGFPGAVQVLQLTRKTRRHRGDRLHTEVVYAVTSLSSRDAHADQIADWLRGHWAIENKLHYVRDVTFDEDRSQNRTAGGPQVMATLRNLAISLLRLNDEPNIASARRHHARGPQRPIKLLLTS